MKQNSIAWTILNYLKLFLKVFFFASLFISSFFVANMSIYRASTHLCSYDAFPLSFASYSAREYWGILQHSSYEGLGETLSNFGNDFCGAMLYVLAFLVLVYFVMNVISLFRPQAAIFYKLQFFSGLLCTMVLVISSVVAVNRCNLNDIWRDEGGSIVRAITGTLSFGGLFYAVLALCILMIGIDTCFLIASRQKVKHKIAREKRERKPVSIGWKYLNVSQLFLKVFFCVVLFISGFFITNIVKFNSSTLTRGNYTLPLSYWDFLIGDTSKFYEITDLQASDGSGVVFAGNIITCGFLLNILAYFFFNVMSLSHPGKTVYYKFQFLSGMANTLMVVLLSVYLVSTYDFHYESYEQAWWGGETLSKDVSATLELGAWFYIALALCIIMMAVDLYFAIAGSQGTHLKTAKKKQESSLVDTINGYKQLLDSGAITEEEYQAMKKDLLGM